MSAFLLGILFLTPLKTIFYKGKPVEKEVNLNIGLDKRYSLPVYANAKADVQITITKWHGKKSTLLWQKSLKDIQLSKNAGLEKVEAQFITIPTSEKKDRIVVRYLVSYKDKGSTVELAYYDDLPKNKEDATVEVII